MWPKCPWLMQLIFLSKLGSNRSQMTFGRCCKKSHAKIPSNLKVGPFCPWILISALEKWPFCVNAFGKMWWWIMKVHIKCGLLKEKPSNLATPCESYGTLNSGIFWNWSDHILLTTHENFKFLDFLEWWDQDLQLSCWTKFHLKLVWWSNFEEKKFPFWAAEITSHLPF